MPLVIHYKSNCNKLKKTFLPEDEVVVSERRIILSTWQMALAQFELTKIKARYTRDNIENPMDLTNNTVLFSFKETFNNWTHKKGYIAFWHELNFYPDGQLNLLGYDIVDQNLKDFFESFPNCLKTTENKVNCRFPLDAVQNVQVTAKQIVFTFVGSEITYILPNNSEQFVAFLREIYEGKITL
jgi:hypothetical protein